MTRGRPGDRREDEPGLREELDLLGRIVDSQEETIAGLQQELSAQTRALGWRLQQRLAPLDARIRAIPGLRHLYRAIVRALDVWVDEGFLAIFAKARHKAGLALQGRRFLVEDRDLRDPYHIWIARHGQPLAHEAARDAIAHFAHRPLISVLTVLDVSDTSGVVPAVATLQAQAYERWELCLAVPSAIDPANRAEIDRLVAGEARARTIAASGDRATLADALGAASGDFIAVLGHGDELASDALYQMAARLQDDPPADVLYSDEDTIARDGVRRDPFFKPDWSPDLLLGVDYLQRFGLFRRSLVEEAGGFSAEAGDAQAYDLALRLTERTDRIVHVPRVLYHRRCPATTADAVLTRQAARRDERRAIAAALARRGHPGHVEAVYARTGPRRYSTRYDLCGRPLVSILIPTRDRRPLLQTTLESIRARTDYDRYEILVVDNGSTEPDAVRYLASLPPEVRVLQWNEPFNYSAINNFAVARAAGDQLLFLNNDVEVVRPDWLHALLEHGQRPDVGAVGAKLLYDDGRIQHAGIIVGINRGAANAFLGCPDAEAGGSWLTDVARNCSAVTGACMLVPRHVFEEAGGFDETMAVLLNDVDLCLRIRQKGYRIVYTPHAVLCHHERSTRGALDPPADLARFQARWHEILERGDPYYNPNLAYDQHDWRPDTRSRRT